MTHPPKLTILLPCLNEAETLGFCIEKAQAGLAELDLSGEVLVADNGSTDGSIDIARKLGARIVSVPRKGYGHALRSGVESAQGQWIIMGDSDASYDFSKLGAFIEKFRQGYDMVMGCRLPQGGGTVLPGAMPWMHRWFGNPALSFIGRLFFRSPVTDFQCGLRGFTREAFDSMQLKSPGMEFATEIVVRATLCELKIAQVPITLHPDGRTRPPHLRSWRDGWRNLRFMLLLSPRWLFLRPGFALFLVGCALFVPLSIGPIRIGHVQFDSNTLLIAGLMIVVGFQILFFGIFTQLYAIVRGLLPENKQLTLLIRLFSLERGIVAGLLAVVVGAGFLTAAILKWKAAGFGQISYSESLRLVIPAVTCMTVGVQAIFSSFFLSILDLQHD